MMVLYDTCLAINNYAVFNNDARGWRSENAVVPIHPAQKTGNLQTLRDPVIIPNVNAMQRRMSHVSGPAIGGKTNAFIRVTRLSADMEPNPLATCRSIVTQYDVIRFADVEGSVPQQVM